MSQDDQKRREQNRQDCTQFALVEGSYYGSLWLAGGVVTVVAASLAFPNVARLSASVKTALVRPRPAAIERQDEQHDCI
jgi:hypothetical protein